MAAFPRTEPEIYSLVTAMIGGFSQNPEVFPALPVAVPALGEAMAAYNVAKNNQVVILAEAEAATVAKDTALENLVEAMKSDIRYAENTVNFNDEKLKLIGWSGRKEKTAIAVPGQPRLLEAPKQGEGWVFLDWKSPADGGKPNAYKVMRRERPAGSWQEVATAVDSEATLVDQPRGKELEYRVVAVNKSGDGEPSNTVMVVL